MRHCCFFKTLIITCRKVTWIAIQKNSAHRKAIQFDNDTEHQFIICWITRVDIGGFCGLNVSTCPMLQVFEHFLPLWSSVLEVYWTFQKLSLLKGSRLIEDKLWELAAHLISCPLSAFCLQISCYPLGLYSYCQTISTLTKCFLSHYKTN